MENEPTGLTPEERMEGSEKYVSQFLEYVKILNRSGFNNLFSAEVDRLLEYSGLQPELQGVFLNEGPSEMKAYFIEELYNRTELKGIRGVYKEFAKIIDFEAA